MSLHHEIGAHAGSLGDFGLRWHMDASTPRFIHQTVVPTLDIVTVEPTLRSGQHAMPARILQSDGAAITTAMQCNLPTADGACKQLALYVVSQTAGYQAFMGKGARGGMTEALDVDSLLGMLAQPIRILGHCLLHRVSGLIAQLRARTVDIHVQSAHGGVAVARGSVLEAAQGDLEPGNRLFDRAREFRVGRGAAAANIVDGMP
jgi:hypothetical protein